MSEGSVNTRETGGQKFKRISKWIWKIGLKWIWANIVAAWGWFWVISPIIAVSIIHDQRASNYFIWANNVWKLIKNCWPSIFGG